jgi:hypothetical protein
VAYGAFSCLKALETNTLDPSTNGAMVFSPGYVYAVVMKDSASKCEKGISVTEALDVLASRGTVCLRDFPEECKGTLTGALERQARGNRISAYRRLFGTRVSGKEVSVRRSLFERKPVVAALWYAGSFDLAEETWAPSREELNRSFADGDTGVAVTVVGYDDRRYGGAFEVMNSQGTGWGKDGFSWVPYAVFNRFCAQAFQMIVDTSIGANRDVQVPEITFAPTPADATLSGSVRFLDLYQGEMRTFRDGEFFRFSDSYPSGAQFKIQVGVTKEAFVYVIASDDNSRRTSTIFPDRRFHMGDQLTPASQVLVPPVGMGYLQLDTTAGVDHFCVLFSSGLLDIDGLTERIDGGEGPFVGRVRAALSQESISSQEIRYADDGSISFWTPEQKRSVVILFVDMEHRRE